MFQFKQFGVEDALCSHKVGTDGVLLGAWVLSPNLPDIRVLDVGTGSGLIALMCAQRFPNALIDGIELDTKSAENADDNFNNSPWSARLKLIKADVLDFVPPYSYDLIVSNPPYYDDHHWAVGTERHRARHTSAGLSFEALLSKVKALLTPNTGLFQVIIPYNRLEQFEALAKQLGLFTQTLILIKGQENTAINRCLISFGFKALRPYPQAQLTLKDAETRQYQEPVRSWVAPFYLKL
jgi:tRNA1Val (adenine37-N6)-methyltransferase